MIGFDTNVLVRYITQDHPEQAAQATRLIETSCTTGTPGRVAHIVLCELVRVLRRAYGYGKPQVVEALEVFREGSGDFSDYLLALSNRAAGCETTYNVDARLRAQAPARLPE